MNARLETFLTELETLVGPGFNGNVVLHCVRGTIVKYEIKQVRRPTGGSVDIDDPIDIKPKATLPHQGGTKPAGCFPRAEQGRPSRVRR